MSLPPKDLEAPRVSVLRNETAMLTEKGKKHGQQRNVAVIGVIKIM